MLNQFVCGGDYVQVLVPTSSVSRQAQAIVDMASLENGTNSSLRSVGRYCGVNAPPTITTLGSLRIRFVTANDSSNRGWVANYMISRECGHSPTD